MKKKEEEEREESMIGASYLEGHTTKRLHSPTRFRGRASSAHSARSKKHSFRLAERSTVSERVAGHRPFRNQAAFSLATDKRLESNNPVARSGGVCRNQNAAPEAKLDFNPAGLKESMESWLLEGLTPGFGSLITIFVGFATAGLAFI